MASRRKSRPKGWKRAAYILRTCDADGVSHNGFKWPEAGLVEALDWKPTNECGNGLHGFLNGEGDGALARFDSDARWIIAEIEDGWIELNGKVKFPRAFVVHCGDRLSATRFIAEAGCSGAIVGGTATAGNYGTATAGYRGTATAGEYGTATAGEYGTATAGDRGTATAGYGGTAIAREYGTATAGDCGTATAGYSGTAIAGDRGTATAGYGGTATAGDCGTAIVGDRGTATAGDRGTATAGYRGTATAGDGGTVLIRFYDGNRYRIIAGYVGEDGIEPNTPYRVKNGKLVKA